MHIRKIALAALLIGSGNAHAQFGMSSMMNPMSMMGPMTMMAPMGMMGMMAAPMMMPMGASMMSAPMMSQQNMMNPYQNRMAANNPSMNQSASRSAPFMMVPTQAPAYGGYGMQAAPVQAAPMSFFPMAPAAPVTKAAPTQAPMSFFPSSAAPAAVTPAKPAQSTVTAPAATTFDPAMWMQMMGMTPPGSAEPRK